MNYRANLYERGLLVYNPTKAQTPRFKKAISEVIRLSHSHGIQLDLLKTDADPKETEKQILKTIKRRDLLITAGGDGTINTATQALIKIDPDERPRLLAAPAGSANDFYRSLNGAYYGNNLLCKVLEKGKFIEFKPLKINIESSNGKVATELYAVNNAGFNFTAEVASLLNQSKKRTSSLLKVPIVGSLTHDLITMGQSAKYMSTFPMTDHGAQTSTNILDRSFVHASKAFKYGRFEANHLDNEFQDIQLSAPAVSSVALAGLSMVTGLLKGHRTHEAEFTTGDQAILGHVDGEVFELWPQSRVHASLADTAIKTFSLVA